MLSTARKRIAVTMDKMLVRMSNKNENIYYIVILFKNGNWPTVYLLNNIIAIKRTVVLSVILVGFVSGSDNDIFIRMNLKYSDFAPHFNANFGLKEL